MIARAVPLWLDLICVGVGAFQGALFAIFNKRFDLVGVVAVAILTGLGGGILRDLLLGVGRPAAMEDIYIITGIGGALAAVILGRWYRRSNVFLTLLDSIAMSLFAIAGTYKAILFDSSPIVVVLLGVITGVGGGVLRDIVCRATPQIFSGGPLYATSTAIGSALFLLLERTSMNISASVAIASVLIVTIHMASIRFKIHLRPVISEVGPNQEDE